MGEDASPGVTGWRGGVPLLTERCGTTGSGIGEVEYRGVSGVGFAMTLGFGGG